MPELGKISFTKANRASLEYAEMVYFDVAVFFWLLT